MQAQLDGEESIGTDFRPVASRLLEALADKLPPQAFDHTQPDLNAPPDAFVIPHAVLVLPAAVDAGRHGRIPVPERLKPIDDVVHPSGLQVGADLPDTPFPFGTIPDQSPQGGTRTIQRKPRRLVAMDMTNRMAGIAWAPVA